MLMRQMADSEKMPVLPDKWPILYSLFGWYSLRARVASQLLLLPRTRRTFLLASHIFTCSPIFVSSNFSPCWGSSPQTPAKGTKSLWNPYVYKQLHIKPEASTGFPMEASVYFSRFRQAGHFPYRVSWCRSMEKPVSRSSSFSIAVRGHSWSRMRLWHWVHTK